MCLFLNTCDRTPLLKQLTTHIFKIIYRNTTYKHNHFKHQIVLYRNTTQEEARGSCVQGMELNNVVCICICDYCKHLIHHRGITQF